MTMLLKTILRMCPDRILVGEVRGPEALDLLDAWNTGHEGGAATLHANDEHSALTRLKSLISRNESAPDAIEPPYRRSSPCDCPHCPHRCWPPRTRNYRDSRI